MLVSLKNRFQQKSMSDLKKYIKRLTNEVSFICICGLLDTYEKSILLVEFDVYQEVIWLYKADGNALIIYLPNKKADAGFHCDPYNFTGKKCVISWLGKKEGSLPF